MSSQLNFTALDKNAHQIEGHKSAECLGRGESGLFGELSAKQNKNEQTNKHQQGKEGIV